MAWLGPPAETLTRFNLPDNKLRSDFRGGQLRAAQLRRVYGDNSRAGDISEGVAGVIAKSLSGADGYGVLDRLLRNSANAQVYRYVDITSYAVLANLPSDVVRILPWAGVANGPTGAMPQDFWQKLGAAASAVVNAFVYVGQLIYKGLVASAHSW